MRGAQFVRVSGSGQTGSCVHPEAVQGAEPAHVPGRGAAVLHGYSEADHRLSEREPSAPKRLHTTVARDPGAETRGQRGRTDRRTDRCSGNVIFCT